MATTKEPRERLRQLAVESETAGGVDDWTTVLAMLDERAALERALRQAATDVERLRVIAHDQRDWGSRTVAEGILAAIKRALAEAGK